MPAAVRLLVHGVALLAGFAVGVLGSFVHAYTVHGVPVGLLLALALCLALYVAAGLATRARSGALAAAGGWLLAVGLLSLRRPEGDLVVPATTLGYLWLFGGTLIAGIGLAPPYSLWAARRAGTHDDASAAPPSGR